MICKNCNKETNNPSFCSRSCANSFHNREIPKRKPEHECKLCKAPINSLHTYCTKCKEDVLPDILAKRKEASIKRRKETWVKRVGEHRIRRKLLLIEYKGGACQICGYKKYAGSLHFHHINPSMKKFTLGHVTLSLDTLQSEVDKCVLLCANCHSEVHAGVTELPT
jgi:hypothetical protein